jgi:hypothetical protein
MNAARLNKAEERSANVEALLGRYHGALEILDSLRGFCDSQSLQDLRQSSVDSER